MAYKNKTYVAFDGDTDMRYFNILKAWRNNKEINFDFYDVHSINTARDTSLTESIKRQLRERFDNSKLFLLLVGEKRGLGHFLGRAYAASPSRFLRPLIVSYTVAPPSLKALSRPSRYQRT
ncbi:TIR domain-containing protein [Thermophilibacter sp.]